MLQKLTNNFCTPDLYFMLAIMIVTGVLNVLAVGFLLLLQTAFMVLPTLCIFVMRAWVIVTIAQGLLQSHNKVPLLLERLTTFVFATLTWSSVLGPTLFIPGTSFCPAVGMGVVGITALTMLPEPTALYTVHTLALDTILMCIDALMH
jgi:hypothetical protein